MFEIFCLLGFYLFIWYQVSFRSTHFQLTLIGCYQHKQIFFKMPRVDSFNLFFMLLLIKIWRLLLCFICLMLYVHFWACSSWQYMVALTFPSHVQFSSLQLLSRVQLLATPWTAARQASLSIAKSWSTKTHVHRVGDLIQPSHPLSSPSPPTFSLSQHQGLFKWVNS